MKNRFFAANLHRMLFSHPLALRNTLKTCPWSRFGALLAALGSPWAPFRLPGGALWASWRCPGALLEPLNLPFGALGRPQPSQSGSKPPLKPQNRKISWFSLAFRHHSPSVGDWPAWAPGLPGRLACLSVWPAWAPGLPGRLACLGAWLAWAPGLPGRLACLVAWPACVPALAACLACLGAWPAWAPRLPGRLACCTPGLPGRLACLRAWPAWLPGLP